MDAPDSAPDDEADAAIVEARKNFLAGFASACSTMEELIARTAADAGGPAAAQLAQIAHRMGGLGGTIGFPIVSTCARALEDLVRDAPPGQLDVDGAQRRLAELRAALDQDLAS
jgi:hypothetical protein